MHWTSIWIRAEKKKPYQHFIIVKCVMNIEFVYFACSGLVRSIVFWWFIVWGFIVEVTQCVDCKNLLMMQWSKKSCPTNQNSDHSSWLMRSSFKWNEKKNKVKTYLWFIAFHLFVLSSASLDEVLASRLACLWAPSTEWKRERRV